MESILSLEQRNNVLHTMARSVDAHQNDMLTGNGKSIKGFHQYDLSMFNRLKLDQEKVNRMALSLKQLAAQEDPVGIERFQFGLGGEMAISTDKLHQNGPIGLQHLVTHKWYVYGNGQIR